MNSVNFVPAFSLLVHLTHRVYILVSELITTALGKDAS